MRVLYIEAGTGISGDMFVAAMLDLGVSLKNVEEVLRTIPIEGFRVETSRVKRAGIDACDFDVVVDEEYENNDHDMEYLYGHTRHGVSGSKASETEGDHAHPHRHWSEIRDILERTKMTDGARKIADRMFEILATAESEAHGVPVENVHFHEVGAIDSIVDIVAAAVCVDELAPDAVVVSPLAEGTGSVRTQHGIMPVPVPAVSHIVQNEGLILENTGRRGEFVTPTGAAIAAAIRSEEALPQTYTIEKVGVGAGKRDYDPPSMLRAMLIVPKESSSSTSSPFRRNDRVEEHICRLETDIDDATGEMLGHVMEKLYQAGAREVHFVPVQMKKNRPGYELVVIATEEDVEKLEGIIFKETTTIGVRRQWMERTVLPREECSVQVDGVKVLLKKCILPDGEVRMYPEYESVRELADIKGISLVEALRLTQAADDME